MADSVTSANFIPAKGSYETLQKISAWNLKALTKLAGLQFKLATLGIEASVAQAKLLTLSNTYDQLYAHETKLVNLYGNRMAGISRETTDVILKSGDELNMIIGGVFNAAKNGMVVKTAPVVKQVVKPAAKKPVKRKPAKKTH